MVSNIHHNQKQQQAEQNMNSGLTRYRSAPSSYFANLINSGSMYGDEDLDPFFNPPVSNAQTESIMSRFMSTGDGHNLGPHQNLNQIQRNEYMVSLEQNKVNFASQSQEQQQQQQQMMYQNHPPTNLVRQSSSPAGFLEQVNNDNGYPNGCSWDGSSMLTNGFLNGIVENDQISSSENQENLSYGGRIQSIHAPTGLTHQLSLPTSSTELSVKEKSVSFQDNVPLRSRAKRGCATHPRSIAERVRRTRISERMRKLQDLVPNMETQTSIAYMLDLAVDYIKQLQNQVETLSDRQTKSTCQNKLRR